MKRVMGYYPGITAARIGCALLRDSDERIQNAQGRTESPVRSHARPEGQAGFEHPSRKLAARAGGAAARGRKSLLVFGPGSSSGPLPLFFVSGKKASAWRPFSDVHARFRQCTRLLSSASTAPMNSSVERKGWSGPIRIARSFVILPDSTTSTQTFYRD